MSFAKSERDYPEGKYIHIECKWCGCSYIGPKHENACKKCDDTLQRMGGFTNLFGKGEENKMTDNVNNPAHYASGGIECIEAIKASMTREAFLGYLKGNIQKYVWRYEKKINPVEDLKKARWYMNRLVEEVENHHEEHASDN
ncbi:DUF3310 domain-containing protein [Moellerella wisconsensis]|uniref:DUF3310 domain-containing protein n=1 Tax=Moellerella wisconsensis TaxID=158849 RepID=A0ACD3Y9X2_9GAMM|nr:DUF3310 domain-containing protein [Moellerella wisconsensis]UNH39957.1 DUF3310 domain-containing protein [Moellerella wisconsensis]